MSFASKVIYTGDGALKSYNIPMPYISTSHIRVFVDSIFQLTTMDYVFTDASTIRFVVAPGDNSAIEIKRETSPNNTLVDFQDGSVLNETDLDTAYLHNYYLTQEYADSFNEIINEALVNVATGAGIIETETDAVIAALVNEMLDTEAAANLQARITDIDANAEAIITLADGLQLQINTLASGVAAAVYIQPEEPIPGVDGIPDPITDGARWYDSDDNNSPYIYILIDLEWVNIEDPRVGQAESDISVLQVTVDDVDTGVVANTAAVVAEAFVRANETGALAQTISVIGAETDAGAAFLLNLNTVKVTAGETLSQRFTAMSAVSSGNAAQIIEEADVSATATGVVASNLSILTAAIPGDIDAAVLVESQARATEDGVLAAATSVVSTAAGLNTASVAVHQSSLDGIEAEYGVDLTSNGYISGFRLINGGVPGESAFVIIADKFAIVATDGQSQTEYTPMQIVGGKVTFTADVDIDGDLVVSGSINGADALSTVLANRIGSTQIGPDAIFSSHIGAGEIKTVNLFASAVTAEKISVTNLAAINADIGAITAGSITMDANGYIRGGQTAYNAGTGFWLGSVGGVFKFSIGNQTDFLHWDGDTLDVKGNVIIGGWLASDTTITSLTATGGVSSIGNGSESSKYKKVTIDRDGTVRMKFSSYYTSPVGEIDFSDGEDPDFWSTQGGVKIYKNGSLVVSRIVSSFGSFADQAVYDIAVVAGDYLELSVYGGRFWDSSASTYRNVTFYSGDLFIRADNTIVGNTIQNDI